MNSTRSTHGSVMRSLVATCAAISFTFCIPANATPGGAQPTGAYTSTAEAGERLTWIAWEPAPAAGAPGVGRLVSLLEALPADLLYTTDEGLLVRVAPASLDRLAEIARMTGTAHHELDLDPAAVGLDARAAIRDAFPSETTRRSDSALYIVYHRPGAAPAPVRTAGRVLAEGRRFTILAARPDDAEALPLHDAAIVRVTPHAKPWPASAAHDTRPPVAGAPFDPLIDQMVAQVSGQSYMSRLGGLLSVPTRYTYSAWCDTAAQRAFNQFTALGLATEFHDYPLSGSRRQVIATLPGRDHPEEVVYVSAHLDDISEAPYSDAPGADDDASGAAAVLEVARVLRNCSFSRTIKFALFTGEEQGLIGSADYVQDIFAAGENVVADFQVDMIAWSGADPAPPDLVIYTGTTSIGLAQRWRDAALAYAPAGLEPIVLVDALAASDHASFWNYGYLAVMGIEDEAWGSDFNPRYHSTQDDFAWCDIAYATNVTRSVLAAAADYAHPLARTSVAAEDWNAEGVGVAAGAPPLRIVSLDPNPTHGTGTTLRFTLGGNERVTAGVFDLHGRRVRVLLEATRPAGVNEVSWDGRDDGGRAIASGLYFVRVTAGRASATERLLLVR